MDCTEGRTCHWDCRSLKLMNLNQRVSGLGTLGALDTWDDAVGVGVKV
jgi:hypothetical protein